MENGNHEITKATAKAKAKPRTDSLRVRKETKKRILGELANLNKKEFGRPVTPDQYVQLAISLLRPEHLERLREQSLTARDRFEQKYREHCEKNGKVSKDEFLATLLG